MKTKLVCFSLVLLLSVQAAWGSHSAMIGGVRGGLALGMETTRDFGALTGRFGIEGATGEDLSPAGDNPFNFFAGLQVPLRERLALSFGFIGYFGQRSEQGEYLSLVLDKLGSETTYAETGFDWFGDHGHVFLQFGYRFRSD